MSSREKLFTHYVVRVRIIPTSIHCILNDLVLAPGLSEQTKHPQGRYRRRHETEGESRRAQGGLPPGGLRVRRASCGDTEEAQRRHRGAQALWGSEQEKARLVGRRRALEAGQALKCVWILFSV